MGDLNLSVEVPNLKNAEINSEIAALRAIVGV